MRNPIMAVRPQSQQSPRGSRRRSNPPRAVRHALALTGAVAACLLVATPAWAADARFVSETTRASWDGNNVQVSFREAGLAPSSVTTVLVEATGIAHGECVKSGVTLFSLQSSATSSDVAEYQADAAGMVDGARTLHLTVGVPVVSGLDCTMVVTRTFTVTLRDTKTGAVLGLSGQAGTAA